MRPIPVLFATFAGSLVLRSILTACLTASQSVIGYTNGFSELLALALIAGAVGSYLVCRSIGQSSASSRFKVVEIAAVTVAYIAAFISLRGDRLF